MLQTKAISAWHDHKILPVEFIESTLRTDAKFLILSIEDFVCQRRADEIVNAIQGKILTWNEITPYLSHIHDIDHLRMILLYQNPKKTEYIQLFDSSTWEVTILD